MSKNNAAVHLLPADVLIKKIRSHLFFLTQQKKEPRRDRTCSDRRPELRILFVRITLRAAYGYNKLILQITFYPYSQFLSSKARAHDISIGKKAAVLAARSKNSDFP